MRLTRRSPGWAARGLGASPLLLAISLLVSCRGPRPDEPIVWSDEPPAGEPAAADIVSSIVIDDGVTLDEALALARRQSPRLGAVRRLLAVAEAQQVTASQWQYNPVLSSELEGTTPFGLGQGAVRVGLSQQFEIAGQRGRREAVAESNADRTRAAIADAERLVAVDVASAFLEALALAERMSLVGRNGDVARQLLEAAEARFAAKQVPGLDVNLVRLELRRVENDLAQATATHRAALLRLTALLGLTSPPTLVGALTRTLAPPVDRELALRRALERRPDLRELRSLGEVFRRQVELEEARRWPDPELGVFYDRSVDDAGPFIDRDHSFGVNLAFPLPIFNTRRGEIAEARAQVAVAEAELEAAERLLAQDVDLALNRLALARQTLALYQGELSPLAQANLAGLETAYRAGEVGTLVVLRAQEDANRVSLGLLDALREYHQARVALAGLTAEELTP